VVRSTRPEDVAATKGCLAGKEAQLEIQLSISTPRRQRWTSTTRRSLSPPREKSAITDLATTLTSRATPSSPNHGCRCARGSPARRRQHCFRAQAGRSAESRDLPRRTRNWGAPGPRCSSGRAQSSAIPPLSPVDACVGPDPAHRCNSCMPARADVVGPITGVLCVANIHGYSVESRGRQCQAVEIAVDMFPGQGVTPCLQSRAGDGQEFACCPTTPPAIHQCVATQFFREEWPSTATNLH